MASRISRRLRHRQRGLRPDTELGLPAGTLEKDHHPACHAPRDRRPIVTFDQGESQIDARADSGPGDERAVLHEKRIRVDLHLGVLASQCLAMRPMSGRAAVVEQAESRQYERACAHRRHAA